MGDNTLEAHVMIKKEGPRPVSERLRKGLEERAVMDKERATKEYGRELADLINETIARFQARRPSHKRVDAGARNGRLALGVPKQRRVGGYFEREGHPRGTGAEGEGGTARDGAGGPAEEGAVRTARGRHVVDDEPNLENVDLTTLKDHKIAFQE